MTHVLLFIVVVVVIVYCYMYRKISSYTKDVCDATRSNKIVEKRYTLHDSWRNAKRHVLSSLLKNERQNEWMKSSRHLIHFNKCACAVAPVETIELFPPSTQFINSRRSILQLVLQSECSKAMHQARLCMNIIQ